MSLTKQEEAACSKVKSEGVDVGGVGECANGFIHHSIPSNIVSKQALCLIFSNEFKIP